MTFNINLKNTIPKITEKDIRKQYINRYFASKANQLDEVFEISRREYELYLDNSYVVLGNLKWSIKGQLEDIIILVHTGNILNSGGMEPITIPGILTQNKASTIFLSKKLPAIVNYLTDYQQFYVGV